MRLKERNKERGVAKEPIAKEARMGKYFVVKVVAELKAGQLIDSTSFKRRRAFGPGSKTFTPLDKVVLLYLQAEKNNRTMEDTRLEL